jgi:hypothetical protein
MILRGHLAEKFLKTGVVAGGAVAVIGLSAGLPALLNAQNTVIAEIASTTKTMDQSFDDFNRFGSSNYTLKERWYFLYATDGVFLVPTDRFGLSPRPVIMYGFTTPLSWNKPMAGQKET